MMQSSYNCHLLFYLLNSYSSTIVPIHAIDDARLVPFSLNQKNRTKVFQLYDLVLQGTNEIDRNLRESMTNNSNNLAETLHFYVFGDAPYLDREELALPSQIASLHPSADFIMHVGDLKKRSNRCRENHYSLFASILRQSSLIRPILSTIGDNDVVECSDKAQAYAWWTQHMLNDTLLSSGSTISSLHNLQIMRQEGRRENFAFQKHSSSGVIFVIGMYIIHSSFEKAPELYNVVDDALRWIQLHEESIQTAKAVVMFGHTFPFHPKFALFRDILESLVVNNPTIPFLYIQGELHHFAVDNPIPDTNNFLRVIVDKGGIADPLEVLVDPDADVPFKLKPAQMLSFYLEDSKSRKILHFELKGHFRSCGYCTSTAFDRRIFLGLVNERKCSNDSQISGRNWIRPPQN